MLEETKVVTSYTNGTNINLNTIPASNFLTSIAISTIVMCKTMKLTRNNTTLEWASDIPYYDDLVDKYCEGVHGAVLSNLLRQNVCIIYRFMEDCVLNDTNKGLYLLMHVSRDGTPLWRILIDAIKAYRTFIESEYELMDDKLLSDDFIYDKYIDDFEKLMLGD